MVMSELMRDLRYAFRILLKHPSSAVIVVITLALGIGANTAIFSVVNTIVFRPLPYTAPQQLVGMWTRDLNRPGSRRSIHTGTSHARCGVLGGVFNSRTPCREGRSADCFEVRIV